MDKKVHIYVGTYTMPIRFGTGQILQGKGEGIYHLILDECTGEFSAPELLVKTDNPSFLSISEDRKTLYAVNELKTYMGEESGSISAFRVDPGGMRCLNVVPTGGTDPCHIVNSKKCIYAANFMSGSVVGYGLRGDGNFLKRISFHQHIGRGLRDDRQEGPHVHAVIMTPDGMMAYVPDLGLDKVLAYHIDKNGALLPAPDHDLVLSPGTGPRSGTFNKDGSFFYLINELQCSISVFRCEKGHEMREIQTISSLPAGIEPKGDVICAHLALTPDGQYLYSSNRGHDSISVYQIGQDGRLQFLENQSCGGKTPRHFCITPSGQFLLCGNQDTDNLVSFEIQADGTLYKCREQLVSTPVCILVG